jgi:hypothetical protein
MLPIRLQSTVPRITTITEHFVCIPTKCAMSMRVSAHFHCVHISFHEVPQWTTLPDYAFVEALVSKARAPDVFLTPPNLPGTTTACIGISWHHERFPPFSWTQNETFWLDRMRPHLHAFRHSVPPVVFFIRLSIISHNHLRGNWTVYSSKWWKLFTIQGSWQTGVGVREAW